MARTILLLSIIGSFVWYVWSSATAVDDGGINPWVENSPIPVIAVSVLLPLLILTDVSKSRRRDSGPIGIGTVIGVRRTGLSVGNQPQLEIGLTVRTPDGQRFDSVTKAFFDVDEIAAVVPGIVLPVRYRHGDTAQVWLDQGSDPAAVQAALDQVHITIGLSSARVVDIAARGVRAGAVVASMRPTGRLVDGNPELVIALLVTRPDGTSFETTVDKVVAANLVGLVQVGRVVTVFYLPGDEHEVALRLPANPHL
jgi:hypothetical protein